MLKQVSPLTCSDSPPSAPARLSWLGWWTSHKMESSETQRFIKSIYSGKRLDFTWISLLLLDNFHVNFTWDDSACVIKISTSIHYHIQRNINDVLHDIAISFCYLYLSIHYLRWVKRQLVDFTGLHLSFGIT